MNADSNPHPRVVVSGATGLIGTRLVVYLQEHGYQLSRLVRRPAAAGASDIFWDPARGEIDAQKLEGAGAVVHLAGENIGAGRWTAERKRLILDSRVNSTVLLSRTLAALREKPKALISASAVGFYGDRKDDPVTEESPPGRGFLAEVCQAWEAACEPAAAVGIRVVNPRFGVVLAGEGGALTAMLPPFRFGLGGPMGDGRQWMSWIALSDLVRLIRFLIETPTSSGPVNAVSPRPVTNAEFTRTLGKVLRRPTIFRLPALVIRALFGEMGEALFLEGARVIPAKLLAAGFSFNYPEVESALRHELNRPS